MVLGRPHAERRTRWRFLLGALALVFTVAAVAAGVEAGRASDRAIAERAAEGMLADLHISSAAAHRGTWEAVVLPERLLSAIEAMRDDRRSVAVAEAMLRLQDPQDAVDAHRLAVLLDEARASADDTIVAVERGDMERARAMAWDGLAVRAEALYAYLDRRRSEKRREADRADLTTQRASMAAFVCTFGALAAVLGLVAQVGVARRERRTLVRLAYDDALTGLVNRAGLERRLGAGDGLVILDIDDFKVINDSLGHAEGNHVLRRLARQLDDAFDDGAFVARIGGDQFAVAVPDGTPDRSRATAKRALDTLCGPLEISGRRLRIEASAGVAPAQEAADPAGLLRAADLALHAAKRAGAGQIALYTRALHEDAMRRLELRAELQRALERSELYLEYQPIVDLDTGSVTSLEALVRWEHPERGRVMPGHFIPLAEKTGLIVPLGEWALREACRRLARWRAEVPGCEALAVAVNVSAVQLREPGFAARVQGVLAVTGLPADGLRLELTESAATGDASALHELHAVGITIVVDDFGKDHSSLGRLAELPIGVLKVDRSFVARMETEPAAAAIVESVALLGRRLGLTTVAEGIEEPSQAAAALAAGIDLGQGYHYARPTGADGVPALLGGRRPALA